MTARRASPWILAGLLALAGAQFLVVRSFAAPPVAQGSRPTHDLPPSTLAMDDSCTRCHGPDGAPAEGAARLHPEPWVLTASPDGATVFAACGPTQTVAVIDVQERALRATLPVGGTVRSLALSPDGRTLAATLRREHRVALLSVDSHRTRTFVRVGSQPAGVAWTADGTRLFVANAYSSDVSIVDVEAGREIRRVPAGREPFVVLRSPDDRTIAVASRRAELDRPEALPRALVTFLDAQTGTPQRTVVLPSCHMIEGAAYTPDGRFLLVPAIVARNRLPILQVARGWVMSSVVAVIDVRTGRVALLPLTEANEGFPDPSGIAVSADGQRAFVAAGGSDEVAVLDVPALLAAAADAGDGAVTRLGLTRHYLLRRLGVGANPRGVVVAGAGARPLVAVAERFGDSVALLDAEDGVRARVQLAEAVSDDPVQRGARNFHSARFTFQQAFSCRSCHPDGHTDGLTYDFDIDGVGRNLLLNRSLHGVAETAPFKWSGLNPTLQRQCGARFAMVLTRADPMDGAELDELVAFLHSLPPPAPDPEAGRMAGRDTGAVERGRKLFERTVTKDGRPIPPQGRCVTCHPPPLYTNRMRADVGTLGPFDKSGLFDVPHLTGAGSKAPYLHDGRALTLEEIWTAEGVGDQHGVVTDLNKADLNDLVEFMKGL